MNDYAIALYAHVVIFACLLGADLGRFFLARVGAVPGLHPSARPVAVRGVLWLSAISDFTLIVIFPAGFLLADALDAYHIGSPAWRLMPWLLPALLLAVTLVADRAAERPGGGRVFGAADALMRAVWGAGQVWDGASVIYLGMTHMVEAHWLAAKLSVYGLLLLLSIPVRAATLQLRRERASSNGDAVEPGGAPLRKLQLPLLVSAILILIIVWLGAAKPG